MKYRKDNGFGDGCVDNEDGTRSPMALGGTNQPSGYSQKTDADREEKEQEDPERWDGLG